MRNYHRKTLIREEGWPLVDGWYWCPESLVNRRIEKERKRLAGFLHHNNIAWGFDTWKRDQKKLVARIAHACHDGRIRAANGWGIEYFRTAGGTARIYGKCRFCDTPISDGLKMVILMEREL